MMPYIEVSQIIIEIDSSKIPKMFKIKKVRSAGYYILSIFFLCPIVVYGGR